MNSYWNYDILVVISCDLLEVSIFCITFCSSLDMTLISQRYFWNLQISGQSIPSSELLFRKFIFISHSSRCNTMLTLKPFISDPLNGKHWSSEYVYTERYEMLVMNFGLLSLNILTKCFLHYRKCHFVSNSTIKIKFR